MIQSSADRLAKLAAKWEEVRAPLTERYRSLKGDSENKESEANLLLEEIKLLRERMKEVADETRLKDDLYKQLVRESRGLEYFHGLMRLWRAAKLAKITRTNLLVLSVHYCML